MEVTLHKFETAIKQFIELRDERKENKAYYGQEGHDILISIINFQHTINKEIINLALERGTDDGFPNRGDEKHDWEPPPSTLPPVPLEEHKPPSVVIKQEPPSPVGENILVIGGSDNPKYYRPGIYTAGNHSKAWVHGDWETEKFWKDLITMVQIEDFKMVYFDEGSYCYMKENAIKGAETLIEDMISRGQFFDVPFFVNRDCKVSFRISKMLLEHGFTQCGYFRLKDDKPEGFYYIVFTNNYRSFFLDPKHVFNIPPTKNSLGYVDYSDETTGIFDHSNVLDLLHDSKSLFNHI